MRKILALICAVVFLGGSVAFAAEPAVHPKAAAKLICITNEKAMGEKTVGQCLQAGDRFAVIDQFGIVHVLTSEEVALTRKINPGILEMRAFGIKGISEAPTLGEWRW